MVPHERGDALARLHIPQLDLGVLAAGGDQRLRGVPVAGLDVPAMTRQHPLRAALAKVPDLHSQPECADIELLRQ